MFSHDDKDKKMLYKIFLMSEMFIFIIAVVIISIFAIMLYLHFPAKEEVAQGIFTGFMAWIGAVIGFYFGQKPVREILTRLEERNEEVIKNKLLTTMALEKSYDAVDLSDEIIEKIEGRKKNEEGE